MIEELLDEKEMAFADELGKHAGQWVAILDFGGEEERVVGGGQTLKEAMRAAEANGYADVSFFKVPALDKVFIP